MSSTTQEIDQAIEGILLAEGAFVNHPKDRGGPTKYGITQKTYSKWLGRDATTDDIKNLHKETAIEIYKANYLYGPRIHTLPHPPMALVFDMSINHGPVNAVKMLQRTVNLASFGPCDVDGVIGPDTRRRVEKAVEKMGNYFQNALVEERVKFYRAIVRRHPEQEVFLVGWVNRADSFILPV